MVAGPGRRQCNIAAAMVVTTMNFGNDEVVMVVLIPLALELVKHQAKQA